MKILFVERSGERGGGVTSLLITATALRHTHQLALGVYGEPPYAPDFRAAGIPTVRLGGRRLELKGALRFDMPLRMTRTIGGAFAAARLLLDTPPKVVRVARVLRRMRPDLLHLNGPPPLYDAEVVAARLVGIPTICHVRGFASPEALPPLSMLFVHWPDQFIGVSEAVGRMLLQVGIPRERIHVIYNASSPGTLLGDAERHEGRARAGLDDQACWAVTAGHLVPYKGIREAIHAVAQVRERGVDLRLLVLGSGHEEPVLRETARQLGLEGAVRFAGWQADPSHFFALADVLLQPSQEYEGFGRSIIEGMACGLPVVGTDVGGIPETFTDGVSGLLARGRGAQPLVEPLERLARDPTLRREMGAAAREEVARRFTLRANVEAVESVYALTASSGARTR